MGFKVPKRTAEITFEGTEYEGAQITCVLDVPLSLYFKITEAAETEDTKTVARLWAEHALESWNLEDDEGEALSTDIEGVMALPPALLIAVVQRWAEQIASVPGPLAAASPNGAVSVESLA